MSDQYGNHVDGEVWVHSASRIQPRTVQPADTEPKPPTIMEPRIVHVIHQGSPDPEFVQDGDRVFKYGQATSGIVDKLIVHDAPRDDREQLWFNACALTRVAPGGTAYWMLRDE